MSVHEVAFSASLETQGTNMFERTFPLSKAAANPSTAAIRTMLVKIFKVKEFSYLPDLICWYDEIDGLGQPDHISTIRGLYLMGVFYGDDQYGREVITHFFVRRVKALHGWLSNWKDDLIFPEGTREFSICAVLPEGFKWDLQGERSPHNHSVVQFTWEQLTKRDIDPKLIIDFCAGHKVGDDAD